MTTPETAMCGCSHKVSRHHLVVTGKTTSRGPCQVAGCGCRGPR